MTGKEKSVIIRHQKTPTWYFPYVNGKQQQRVAIDREHNLLWQRGKGVRQAKLDKPD